MLSNATNKNTTAKVGSELNNVSLLEPYLRGVLVCKLSLEELLRETALHIKTLIVTEFPNYLREYLAEPG